MAIFTPLTPIGNRSFDPLHPLLLLIPTGRSIKTIILISSWNSWVVIHDIFHYDVSLRSSRQRYTRSDSFVIHVLYFTKNIGLFSVLLRPFWSLGYLTLRWKRKSFHANFTLGINQSTGHAYLRSGSLPCDSVQILLTIYVHVCITLAWKQTRYQCSNE